MLKRITLPLGALLILACALRALAADPTPDQIYQAARSGNLAAAQQMMAQVLRDQPQSGQAHYLAAEIDARAGNYALARQELATAQSLQPGLPFADARSVLELRQQLGEAPLAHPLAQRPAGRSPRFGLFLILIGAAVVLWMVLRRRAAAMGYRQPGPYPGAAPPTYGPGYPGGYMPGAGPGVMTSIASGLALGAGAAAGEELAQHIIGGSRPSGGGAVPPAEAAPVPDPNADMGGSDFGVDDSCADGKSGDGAWDDGGGNGGDHGGGWS